MEDCLKLLIQSLGPDRVKENIDISEHIQSGHGGRARAFYIATTLRELIKAVGLCRELKIDYLIIGSGSKIGLAEGFLGLVIKNRSDALKIFGIKGKVSRSGLGIEEALIEAESGTSLNKLCEYSLKQGLGGFETLKGIPGTLGGSLRINQILGEKAQQVKTLGIDDEIDTKTLSQVTSKDVILSAVFKLKAKNRV